ncbi:MAG: preprotein translocase subunit SecG [Nitrospinae bacterium]|nr:preprotein translocase subunit SecG [Nitrospinota bacterium]
MLETLLIIVHVLIAFTLVVVVLFQQGKGANIGASSQTMFGPRGPFQFLAKATTGIAVGFMITSITLSVLSNNRRMDSVIPAGAATPGADELPTTLPEKAPADAAPTTDGPVAQEPAADTGGPVEGPVDGPAATEPAPTDASAPADAK